MSTVLDKGELVTLPNGSRRWVEEDRGYRTPCWTWQLQVQQLGYGVAWVPGERRKTVAHRFVYEQLTGPVPDGLTLDHLCRQRDCVNPTHLEPVSHRENCLRGDGVSARNARKTHCPQGHPYDSENTLVTPAGARRCRACLRKQRGATQRPAAERTHCPHGHPYDEENTGRTRRGHRYCKTCNRARVRRNG